MDKRGTIVDRLNALMDGREKYPWGQSIGLGKGVIDGMTRTGSIPGGDTLSAIRRCENARIDWILDGRGTPYSVACVATDEAAADLLRDLLEEPGWRISIVTDTKRIAVVLVQDGSFDVKDGKDADGGQQYRTVHHSIVEVVVGNIGRAALDLVRAQPAVSLQFVKADVLDRIERGQVGTWRLLHSPDAILAGQQPIDKTNALYDHFGQQQLFPATSDEADVLGQYRVMTPAAKSAWRQVGAAMEKSDDAGPAA